MMIDQHLKRFEQQNLQRFEQLVQLQRETSRQLYEWTRQHGPLGNTQNSVSGSKRSNMNVTGANGNEKIIENILRNDDTKSHSPLLTSSKIPDHNKYPRHT